jgi:putative transposase
MSRYKPIVLTSDEREQLRRLVRSGTSPARTITRARILLLTDDGLADPARDEVACGKLDCHVNTARSVRQRYRSGGLEAALYDRRPPGEPKKVTGDVEAQLTLLCCSDPPEGRARWTLRLLAGRMVELGHVQSLSHAAVGKALKIRAQALAGKAVVHRHALGPLRRPHGGRARPVRPAVRPPAARRLPGRGGQGTPADAAPYAADDGR